METFLTWWPTVLGAVCIALALRDVFHTLWHPTGRGGISRLVMAAVWRAGSGGRRRHPRGDLLGGPLAMVLVVLTWGVLVVLGGALVVWPHLVGGFSYSVGLDPATRVGFMDALYVSMVTTATLGFGDVVPTAGWLRAAVPLQAFIGFALLTAAVTWVLQLYPALIRRRTLAVRLATLHRADPAAVLRSTDGTLAVQVLDGLGTAFAQVRVDLTQYPETYYFRDGTPEASLPAMVPVATGLAATAQEAPSGDVRLAGQVLRSVLDDYAQVVAELFLRGEGAPDDLLRAYAADHGYAGRDGAAARSAPAGRRSRK